ncbi:MAG: glutathione S-transferase [Hyphomicrobiales bacterium]|nr:MAG: glutathione S-transferase [Hyphomicrobiales bacterium]
MPHMKLFIGNKNYSSWSFRPWIAMMVKGVEFEEQLIQFDFEAGNPKFAEFSPTNKVPVLHDDGVIITESLAILEYINDKFPEKGFWPGDIKTRALARSIAHEMHGGFSGIRNDCPMNMRREIGAIDVSDQTRKDVRRIETIWRECLERFGGPFLFGEFTIADAMFAPVVNRLEIYQLSDEPEVQKYSAAMKGLYAWQEWEKAGRAEPWIVEEDEA